MYQYPQFEVNDDIYKQVRLAYGAVQRIADQLDERANGLSTQRRDIETRLLNESKEYSQELNEVKQNIDGFREKFAAKSYAEYNNQIDTLKEKLRVMSERQKSINKKQEDLEWSREEFPLLELCSK